MVREDAVIIVFEQAGLRDKVEPLRHPGRGPLVKGAPTVTVGQQARQRRRHGVDVSLIGEQAGPAFLHRLADPARAEGDHRRADGLRLQIGDAERLGMAIVERDAAMQIDLRLTQLGADRLLAQSRMVRDLRQLRAGIAQRFVRLRTVADHHIIDRDALGRDLRQRVDHVAIALIFDEPRDRHDPARHARAGIGTEYARIDADIVAEDRFRREAEAEQPVADEVGYRDIIAARLRHPGATLGEETDLIEPAGLFGSPR
ncbi:hypothetical protein GCM10020258_38130 [Sphingomonas yabuuchiae]